jgi:hypothetical protein
MAIGSAAAYAAPPSVTVSGGAMNGASPDSTGFSQVYPDATLTGTVASGTLETRGRYGGITNDSYYAFTGKVTCMVLRGNRVFVGALGSASKHEEFQSPAGEVVTSLPGSYMQVMELEFGHFAEYGERSNHAFETLGTHHEGVPATAPPKCKEYVAKLKGGIAATRSDTLSMSPSITKPKDGFTTKAGLVKFAGTGEPNTAVKLDEGEQTNGADVSVNANGKWSATLVVVGEVNFTARAVGGSTIPSNAVFFDAFS